MQAIDSTTGRPAPEGGAEEGAHAGPERLKNLAIVGVSCNALEPADAVG